MLKSVSKLHLHEVALDLQELRIHEEIKMAKKNKCLSRPRIKSDCPVSSNRRSATLYYKGRCDSN
jgi:hypothetical protein